MEHGEMIHDFVDGTLDNNLENGLFVELASNQQLRSELKQFIDFERTARYDTAAYAPSAASTAGVFSRLGIPLPLATTAVVAPAATGILATLGKYSQGIIGGVVAMLMTAGVMYFAMDNNLQTADGRRQTENIHQVQGNEYKNNSITTNDIPIVKSEEKVAPKVIERIVVKYVDRPIYIEQTADSRQQTELMDNGELIIDNEEDSKKINIENSNLASIDNLPKVNLFENLNNQNNFNPIGVQENPYSQQLKMSDYLGELGVSVEVTGTDYWTFPKETIPKSASPILENKRLALILKLSDQIQAGAELRQEFFYHQYEDADYLYKQNNNYLTGNVFLRWIPLDFDVASIFGQVSYGGNIGGQVGRIMLGTLIKPSSDYSLVIGLEGSSMMYYHNNTPFLANKIGFHYGMMFNF